MTFIFSLEYCGIFETFCVSNSNFILDIVSPKIIHRWYWFISQFSHNIFPIMFNFLCKILILNFPSFVWPCCQETARNFAISSLFLTKAESSSKALLSPSNEKSILAKLTHQIRRCCKNRLCLVFKWRQCEHNFIIVVHITCAWNTEYIDRCTKDTPCVYIIKYMTRLLAIFQTSFVSF